MINLASFCHKFEQFFFCSSTASVTGQSQERKVNPIPEEIYQIPPPSNSLGYSKSKWVAEAICLKAAESSRMSGRVKIMRVGQLTGDTKNGVWNRSEAWPLMLSAARELESLPRLDENLSWLPVDVAAQAVIDISLGSYPHQDQLVYHLVNNDQTVSWMDLVQWVNKQRDDDLSIVEPMVWLDKLESLDQHPAKSLLGLWRGSFKNSVDRETDRDPTIFDTRNAVSGSFCMRDVGPVDEMLVGKIWHWLQKDKGGSGIFKGKVL